MTSPSEQNRPEDITSKAERSPSQKASSALIGWLERLVSIQTEINDTNIGIVDSNVAEGLDRNFNEIQAVEHPQPIQEMELINPVNSDDRSPSDEIDFLHFRPTRYVKKSAVNETETDLIFSFEKDGIRKTINFSEADQRTKDRILAQLAEGDTDEQTKEAIANLNRANNASKVSEGYKPIGDNSEEFAKTLIASTRSMLEKFYAENNLGRKLGLKAKEALERLNYVTDYEEFIKFSAGVDFGSLNLQRLQLAKEVLPEPKSTITTRRSFIEAGLTTFAGLGLGFMANKLMSANPPTRKNLQEAKIIAEPNNTTESWLQRKSRDARAKQQLILDQQAKLPKHNTNNITHSDAGLADSNRELQVKLEIPGSEKPISTVQRLKELSDPDLRDKLLEEIRLNNKDKPLPLVKAALFSLSTFAALVGVPQIVKMESENNFFGKAWKNIVGSSKKNESE
jgi:hypothetical protein